MRKLLPLIAVFFCVSCFPIRIAPTIDNDKVMVAKKFKRQLPKQYAFIFEDPKDANEFYNYINTKYQLNHQDVEYNVPFEIDGKVYFFSFYEVEIPDKTFNILPFFIDVFLSSQDFTPIFEDAYTTRIGNWYLAITVRDDALSDCLVDHYENRDDIINYLKDMRVEYLGSNNYLEAFLKE